MMSPVVELSPQTFARLQSHAVPLVDNIESVINRIIDHYETERAAPNTLPDGKSGNNIREFPLINPPDLTHTKIVEARFCGKRLDQSQKNWNGLLFEAIKKMKSNSKSFVDMNRNVLVNIVEGQKTDEGYRFLADVGISVQGQDANSAWRAASHIANQLGCELSVTFAWRDKDGAAFPGKVGQLSILATKNNVEPA